MYVASIPISCPEFFREFSAVHPFHWVELNSVELVAAAIIFMIIYGLQQSKLSTSALGQTGTDGTEGLQGYREQGKHKGKGKGMGDRRSACS